MDSFKNIIITARGARATLRTNGEYGWIDADEMDRLPVVPDYWGSADGRSWKIVDSYPGMDALVERVIA